MLGEFRWRHINQSWQKKSTSLYSQPPPLPTKESGKTVPVINYERESVNRSQIDIKRKTRDIRTWKKHLFLDMSSTNTDRLVPSLYHCVETHIIEVFWLLSQPLQRLRFTIRDFRTSLRAFLDRVVNRFTR
jgi:hypothetical protein